MKQASKTLTIVSDSKPRKPRNKAKRGDPNRTIPTPKMLNPDSLSKSDFVKIVKVVGRAGIERY